MKENKITDVQKISFNESYDMHTLHKMWIIKIKENYFYISFISAALDTYLPECMAFECDEDGEVADWDGVAVNHEENAQKAFELIVKELSNRDIDA